MKVYIWTHTHRHTRAHAPTHTLASCTHLGWDPAESVWLTVLSELRTRWGGKGRGGGGTELRRGWIGKGWRSIRMEAEVSGVSERRSCGVSGGKLEPTVAHAALVCAFPCGKRSCFSECPFPVTLLQKLWCRLSWLQSTIYAEQQCSAVRNGVRD